MRIKSLRSIYSTSTLALAAAILAPISAPALAQEVDAEEQAEATADSSAEIVAPGIPAWGLTDAEMPADPDVVFGTLENGMRYAIKSHSSPEKEASIRFLVKVGAREERDEEEGAAHFIEHMAFNGSTNIPEGELVPMLERLGLAFGADTNAETSLEYTMYKLDLPNVDTETVDTSLMIMREMASELTIAPDAVERERGIILSEYQVRNSPQRRRLAQVLSDVMETTRVGDRVTAEPASIAALTAEKLRGFYEGYYRPERSTMVIVGDLDPTEIEAKLVEKFGDWQGKGEARARLAIAPAAPGELVINTMVDPGIAEIVDLQRVVPYEAPDNSFMEFRDSLLDQVAAAAITNRINVYAKEENPRTLGGQAFAQDLYQSARAYSLLMIAADGEWANSLALAEQEWRRVAQHGFTFSEVEETKTNIASNFKKGAEQTGIIPNTTIATQIALSSLANSVYSSPVQNDAIFRAIADTITPEAVQQAFLKGWGEAPTYMLLSSKTEIPDVKSAIASVLEESAKVAVTKPEEAEAVTFAYTDFGTPGEIVSDSFIEDLEIRALKFANGVQLNLKKTDFDPNQMSIRVEVGQGNSVVPAGYPGLGVLTSLLASGDGLGAHKIDELRRVLAGKQVFVGYALQEDAISLNATVAPEDTLLQLQLMAAQISDPAFSDETQRQWAGVGPIIVTNVTNNAEQMLGVSLQAILTDGDERMGFEDPSVIASRSVEDLKAVIGPQFANGAIEIAIVGDFDEEAIIKEVASTFGALDRPDTQLVEPSPITFTEDRSTRTVFHTGELDQGAIALSWPTEDAQDMRRSLTRQLLAELFRLRALEVLREELGATYTPSVQSTSSLTFDGYGHITVSAPAEPSTMDKVSQTIRDLAAEFVAAPPSDDSLARARNPILERYERQVGQNQGWTGIVVETQSNPSILDRRRQRDATLRSISPSDIQAAARKFLTAEPVEVRSVPAPRAEEASE